MKTEIPVEISPKIKNVLHLFSSDKTESIMLIVPALGVKARYYFDFCQRIVELLDVSAAVMDWRGNGDSSLRVSRGNNWGMKELIEDVNFTIDWLQEKYPNKKINILGHSLGGQVSVLLSARFSGKINRLILVASSNQFYKGYDKMKKQIYWGSKIMDIITGVLGYYPGKYLGFGGTESRGLMKDWASAARSGKYRPENDTFNYEEKLKSTVIPVVAFCLEGDDLAPEKAVKNLIHKYPNHTERKYFFISKKEYGKPDLGHFNWAKEPDYLIAKIEDLF